jgi:hypothetical protein
MPIGYCGAAALAPFGAATQSGHLGRRAGLVDEHQLDWIEVGLVLEPSPAPASDVRAVLPAACAVLFLKLMSRRSKKRHSEPIPTDRPRSSRSFVCSSAKVMSDRCSIRANRNPGCASIRPDR